MARLFHVHSAALGAALVFSAFGTAAEAQDAATPAGANSTSTMTTTTTQTTETQQAPAPSAAPSSYETDVVNTDGESFEARRAGGAHEPLLDTETQRLTWPNVPLLATGATVFAASYIPAIVGGVVSDRGDNDLYIPVAGPWLTLAQGPSESNTEKTLLIVDGAVQGLGALMLATSFFIPEKTTKNWYLIGSNDVRLAPAAGRGTYGLSAAGRF